MIDTHKTDDLNVVNLYEDLYKISLKHGVTAPMQLANIYFQYVKSQFPMGVDLKTYNHVLSVAYHVQADMNNVDDQTIKNNIITYFKFIDISRTKNQFETGFCMRVLLDGKYKSISTNNKRLVALLEWILRKGNYRRDTYILYQDDDTISFRMADVRNNDKWVQMNYGRFPCIEIIGNALVTIVMVARIDDAYVIKSSTGKYYYCAMSVLSLPARDLLSILSNHCTQKYSFTTNYASLVSK